MEKKKTTKIVPALTAAALITVSGGWVAITRNAPTTEATAQQRTIANHMASVFVAGINATENAITAVPNKPTRTLEANTLHTYVDLQAVLKEKTTTDQRKILNTSAALQALEETAEYEWRMQTPPQEAPSHNITQAQSTLNQVGTKQAKNGHHTIVFAVVTKRHYNGQPNGLPWSEEAYFVGTLDRDMQEFSALDRLDEMETKQRWAELNSILK